MLHCFFAISKKVELLSRSNCNCSFHLCASLLSSLFLSSFITSILCTSAFCTFFNVYVNLLIDEIISTWRVQKCKSAKFGDDVMHIGAEVTFYSIIYVGALIPKEVRPHGTISIWDTSGDVFFSFQSGRHPSSSLSFDRCKRWVFWSEFCTNGSINENIKTLFEIFHFPLTTHKGSGSNESDEEAHVMPICFMHGSPHLSMIVQGANELKSFNG